ncbi:MAG: YebC/PmpR family DNA-binding transcriptional regulator [Paludibacteraceae bacterium]|nr:YebC/PmpR family DNA-binding transcriptional regulator [Paludibacteraceae bacterium]
MGRAFEYRKATKLKRWGHMSRTFTKLGKEITIAAREGGPDPDSNPRLRALIQQCKRENMPKDNIDRAIKKATDKSSEGYKEINYEGYGPHGIAIFVETATDNHMRTVANIRSYFTKFGGTLGTQGSLQFLFDRKACFTVTMKDGIDLDELELELIDFGVEELGVDEEENTIVIYSDFNEAINMQKYLEEHGFEIQAMEFVRIPNDTKELSDEQRESVQKLIDKIEEDEDVQNVFTNMAE